MSTSAQLFASDGHLHTALGEPIVYHYPYPEVETPEVDRVKWPEPNLLHLRSALYDAREVGVIPNVKTVLLPDGSEFHIDEEVGPQAQGTRQLVEPSQPVNIPPAMDSSLLLPMRQYLGDAVYAEFDGENIELRVGNHNTHRVVVLDRDVMRQLIDFYALGQQVLILRKQANSSEAEQGGS